MRSYGINMPAVAYAATSLASGMMHSVFQFYYVKVYLNFFHVSQPWFQVAQVIFMIWNAINDPWFGYIQDNYNFSWVKSRRHSVLYGALPFAVSFVLPWFPWGDYSQESWLSGFQLMVVLCLYDALFTFVLLAQCALFTEMSGRQEDRLRLVKYSQVGSLLGSFSVFFCNYFSDNLNHYGIFQFCTLVIAVMSCLCMVYTGRNTHTEYDTAGIFKDTEVLLDQSDKNTVEPPLSSTKSSEYSYWQQTLQIFTQRSFISFVLMNFLQIFHAVFLSNFLSIFCDQLISDDQLSSKTRSIFYGSLMILPQVLVILCTDIVAKFGYYRVIRSTFILKVMLGVMLYIVGPQWWYLIIHFLIDNCANSASFSLFNLPLSDIIDVDKEKYNRKHPLSSMVFGTNALVTKPAISLAPMLVSAILTSYGYSSISQATSSKVAIATHPPLSATQLSDLHYVMFLMSCIVPVVMGVLQYLIWSIYTIRDSHTTFGKYVET